MTVVKLNEYLTVAEAAAYIGVSPDTLRRWDRAKKLTARRHPVTSYRLYLPRELDDDGRPLLACLCANARDPLLRMTASRVLSARVGEVVTSADLEEAVEASAPSRFSAATRKSIAQNTLSSWT